MDYNPIKCRYITYKPQLFDLQANLANYGAPPCRMSNTNAPISVFDPSDEAQRARLFLDAVLAIVCHGERGKNHRGAGDEGDEMRWK